MHSGDADLSRVHRVIDELPSGGERFVIVMKSTVPVGTGEKVRAELDTRGLTAVGYVVEPGVPARGPRVADFMEPDRIVIGADAAADGRSGGGAVRRPRRPMVRTDPASAEMIKYASNAFLATKISFINEIANVCEEVGADVSVVAHAMGLDERIGAHFLAPASAMAAAAWPDPSWSRCAPPIASRTCSLADLHRRHGGGGVIHPRAGGAGLADRRGHARVHAGGCADRPRLRRPRRARARARGRLRHRHRRPPVPGAGRRSPPHRAGRRPGCRPLVPRVAAGPLPPINPIPGITGALAPVVEPLAQRVAWTPIERIEPRGLLWRVSTRWRCRTPGTFVTSRWHRRA